ncbi:MAG: ABC transporter permease [Gammaproteobacteria bacterium]|nr:ABC transporter permease [Gammaproteobacteria bacterium]
MSELTAAAKRGLAGFGRAGIVRVADLGGFGLFLTATVGRALTPPYRLAPLIHQVHFIGARSVLVIVVAGAFVGMVVALQFYNTLVRFGSVSLMGAAVGLSLVRELGPVLTALMIIGRAGSAMCAEIGIMRMDEQIDALECMSIDPLRFLMVPRLLGTVIAVPLLTAMFDVIGIAGGWLVGVRMFGVNEGAYFEGMYDALVWSDVNMGIVKSLVFGVLIAWITTGKGYYLHRTIFGSHGAEGVSRVTTDAVVMAAIAVLGADYVVSALLI